MKTKKLINMKLTNHFLFQIKVRPTLKQINKKIEKLVKETDQFKKELKLLNNF